MFRESILTGEGGGVNVGDSAVDWGCCKTNQRTYAAAGPAAMQIGYRFSYMTCPPARPSAAAAVDDAG